MKTFFWQVRILLHKEMLLETRSRNRLSSLLPFGVLVLLLFSFAVGPQPLLLRRLAPGFLWLAILLASVVSLAESLEVERQNGALDGIRLLGVPPEALFLAKAGANWLFLLALGLVLVPVAVALYDAGLALSLWHLALTLVLGTGAISAPGTLFAALAADLRSRDVLLPLLMFPLLVPGLLASVRATSLTLLGDPMDEFGGWMGLLVAFNLVYWLLCTVLFERVAEA